MAAADAVVRPAPPPRARRIAIAPGPFRGPRLAATLFVCCAALAAGADAGRADIAECLGREGREAVDRVEACTALIETPGVDPQVAAEAYAERALAHSLRRQYDMSIADYDRAIDLRPNFAMALNNRAWAYFKKGEAIKGLPDAERSLQLDPLSAPSYDTRAHIRQTMGDKAAALSDYNRALRLADPRLVKLYQCGLKNQGLYTGPLDGLRTNELYTAMRACVEAPKCDPLPADEECPDAVS